MSTATASTLKLADEVWVICALLHRENASAADFTIDQVMERARKEGVTGALRRGFYVHVVQHCVANRPPNPGRYRILTETREGRRRLYRIGDSHHPAREGGKTIPNSEDLPPEYRNLVAWYHAKYALRRRRKDEADSILELRGLGKGLWKDEDPDSYIRRLREGWE